jgi:glutamate 5-kinase
LEARKRWILAETARQSRVVIDTGAARALREQGRSLLPAGIVRVEGAFDRGQTIRIFNEQGVELARGLTQYRASDLALIGGKHSALIEEMLGYTYGPEVVHRDDMVMVS